MIDSTIQRYHGAFPGAEAFVVASGPSAGMVNPDVVRRFGLNRITIGTNDVWRVLDGEPMECDFFVILDRKFYEDNWKHIAEYRIQRPRSMPVTYFEMDTPHLRIPIDLQCDAREEMRRDIPAPYDPNRYFHGHSSGVAACQFALRLGCKRIYLLGHDLISLPHKTHGFGVRQLEKETNYSQGLTMQPGYDLLARHADELGVEVVNLSPISALTQFPKQPEMIL